MKEPIGSLPKCICGWSNLLCNVLLVFVANVWFLFYCFCGFNFLVKAAQVTCRTSMFVQGSVASSSISTLLRNSDFLFNNFLKSILWLMIDEKLYQFCFLVIAFFLQFSSCSPDQIPNFFLFLFQWIAILFKLFLHLTKKY